MKHREEHQRIVEMYEGSGRYKDVKELYESKLQTKETELMSAKESLISAKLREEQQLKDFGQKLSEAHDTVNETKTLADIKAAEKAQTIIALEAKLE